VRWENKNTCRWHVLLVICVPKIFLNGQFYFNLSSKTWSHVFLEHCVNIEKACQVTSSPIPPYHAPFPIATIFGVWSPVADVINHANFYLNWSKGCAARRAQNLPYSVDLMYRPYNSVSTNVLHCDVCVSI